MSIGVQSYPELYTLLIGWDLYGKLWSLLTKTGIAYIPFIGIILKNITHSYAIHGHKCTEDALRSMEFSLVTTLLIIFFTLAPLIPVDAQAVTYTPVCSSDKGSAHAGDSGTTYDKAFSIPSGDIRVPVWWYAIISISEGLTNAASTMVGCVPDLRKMVTEVNMAKISDPQLKSDLQDFELMCYMPAKTQYYEDQRNVNTANLSKIDESTKKYGVEDTEWAGSHGFAATYYQKLKAQRPVRSFPYAANQDINADEHNSNPPANGTPNCYEWWNQAEYGLKKQLSQVLPKSFYSQFNVVLNEKEQESLIKSLAFNVSDVQRASSPISETSYSNVMSSIGSLVYGLVEYPKLYAAAQAAPIIQAILLLLIYVFLPFGLVFSGYQPRSVVTASLIIFSVIFFTFIWQLITWTDSTLIKALYPDWFARNSPQAALVDMIISSLILFAPLAWFGFMSMMGILAGDWVGKVGSGLSGVGEGAAKGPVNVASGVVKASVL